MAHQWPSVMENVDPTRQTIIQFQNKWGKKMMLQLVGVGAVCGESGSCTKIWESELFWTSQQKLWKARDLALEQSFQNCKGRGFPMIFVTTAIQQIIPKLNSLKQYTFQFLRVRNSGAA